MSEKAAVALLRGERRFKQDGFTVAWAIDREQGRVGLRLLLGERRPKDTVLDGGTSPVRFELEEGPEPRARRVGGELRLETREGGRRVLEARLRFGGRRVFTGPLVEWEPAPPGSTRPRGNDPEGTPSSNEDWF